MVLLCKEVTRKVFLEKWSRTLLYFVKNLVFLLLIL